ncbi:GNAT family N-acetyltransferase [Virgibacillus oceani]|uniref:N-acetyltransferase domain-containing protein n=1 Tax=Virgibacillus oceani TaxID=1479511 RepID=A0A917M6S1_9BACI|nr:GNAT family N-acetyltransferase [Virgibacillus oceani]GGG78640.1 hypothetical protein GCM10011398_24910 [Virgibacillus oceani]
MRSNKILEQVSKIEDMEIQLTAFNSKRALSSIDKQLEVKKIGDCRLIYEPNSPSSIYYNRVKGFGLKDIDKLEQILDIYTEQNINPCFDTTPNNINEEVAMALVNHGYKVAKQVAFMQLIPRSYEDFITEMDIVEVTEENAEQFINIVIESNDGMDIDASVIERKAPYFYKPNFCNVISYIKEKVASMGSLFIEGNEGYIANDYTFEDFRGMGSQKALLMYRINKAKELGLEKLYTDVEFGSISHNNMQKLGFETVYINSYWMKLK